MRRSKLVVGLALTAALCAGSVFTGCGGGTDNPNNPAGLDASATKDTSTADTSTSTPDTSTGPVDSGKVPCTTDASLNGDIPDAAINDAGATTASCFSCARSSCSAEVSACNAECECVNTITTLFTCLGNGGTIITCGSGLIAGGSQAATPLGSCIVQKCGPQCGINFGGGGGGDASTTDSGPKDAASGG